MTFTLIILNTCVLRRFQVLTQKQFKLPYSESNQLINQINALVWREFYEIAKLKIRVIGSKNINQ